jgi:DNA-binding winged helix-turn-helix (wHTH) protein
MSQHDLATADKHSCPPNPSTRFAGRSPVEYQSPLCNPRERMSRERKRQSSDPKSSTVPWPSSLSAKITSADSSAAVDVSVISFGLFHVLPSQRLLLEGERPIQLGSRAFDILLALVDRAGELVRKSELTARVWPNVMVEESNLKVQIAALRRALRDGEDGNRYISTVTGRGYWFVAPVLRSTGMGGDALI